MRTVIVEDVETAEAKKALLDFWGNEGSSCCRPQHRN